MHVRVCRVRRGGKICEYPQLVESYRRKSDGMPAHRVVMGLSHLTPLELDNFRTSLGASREGKKVVVTRGAGRRPLKPTKNFEYLAVAVLLEVWREWEFDELFGDLLPIGDAVVAPSAIVVALVIQRCVAPGSKLYAERWFPKTALPELLGVSLDSFHNTRVHRVLDGLDQIGCELMAKLARRYAARDGAFAALFVDVTDTWFVGHGPPMAEWAKIKEGTVRRKVGIVLLCNEHGYPLRWEVIRGKESDKQSMARMVSSISGLSWVGDTPLVCDRAMGNTAQIRQLLDTKIRFVTALVSTEFGSYTDAVPHQAFADFVVAKCNTQKEKKELAARAGKLAESAGMKKVDDKLYVLDLGVVERPATNEMNADASASGEEVDNTIKAMRHGRQMREAVAEGRASSLAAAGRGLGLGKSVTKRYRRLANLSEGIQLAVLDGKASGVTIDELLKLIKHSDVEEQQQAFEQLAAQAPRRAGKPKTKTPTAGSQAGEDAVRVRAVAYFNPEMFVEQREGAQRRLAEIAAFVDNLNRRLAAPCSKMTEGKIFADVHQKLRRYEFIEAYEVQVSKQPRVEGGRDQYVVELTLKAQEWRRRRRYDGFSLLVAHPDVKQSAVELCRLYRSKDKVEKSFETIKSFVKLRPVRHRTDAKVRAHVTICMLALLLERTLNRKLGEKWTAQSALDELGSCNLNYFRAAEEAAAPTEVGKSWLKRILGSL